MAHVDLSNVFEEYGWGDIPEEIMDIMQSVPFWHPDDIDEEGKEGQKLVYERILNGKCMACRGPLREDTMLTIARAGIVMIHCGGACYSDQQVLGWLEEQYSDMVDTIKFRGGAGDVPNSTDE